MVGSVPGGGAGDEPGRAPQARDEAFPEPEPGTFLVNSRGGPLGGQNIQHTLAVLIAAAGVRVSPADP